VIWGETEHDGLPVLNTGWPRDRGLFFVGGLTEGGQLVEVYSWDDCEGDALESALEWCGEEGSDDDGLSVRRVHGEERAAVLRASDEAELKSQK